MIVVMFKTRLRADADVAAYEAVTFESEETLEAWRRHPEHVEVQQRARREFYDYFWAHALKTIRQYEWKRDPPS